MADKKGGLDFAQISYGTFNPIKDSNPSRNSGSRRRGNTGTYVNHALQKAYGRHALATKQQFYGIVINSRNMAGAAYTKRGPMMTDLVIQGGTDEGKTSTKGASTMVFKVYIPELDPRPYPLSPSDPVIYTYPDVYASPELEAMYGNSLQLPLGALVIVEYGDLKTLRDPTIVGYDGNVWVNFDGMGDAGTLTALWKSSSASRPNEGVSNPKDNLVYKLKYEKAGPPLEVGDHTLAIVGSSLGELVTATATIHQTQWSGKKESDEEVQAYLQEYWGKLGIRSYKSGDKYYAWSGAYVSFIANSDPGANFPGKGAHTLYAAEAKQGKGGWTLWLTSAQPAKWEPDAPRWEGRIQANVGDVLIKPPTGGRLTGPDAKVTNSHGDIVYQIHEKKAFLTGGNLSDTAKIAATLELDDEGCYTSWADNSGANYELILKKNGKTINSVDLATATEYGGDCYTDEGDVVPCGDDDEASETN